MLVARWTLIETECQLTKILIQTSVLIATADTFFTTSNISRLTVN